MQKVEGSSPFSRFGASSSRAYVPTVKGDDDFALTAGFARRDADARPISEIPEDELLNGFGSDARH